LFLFQTKKETIQSWLRIYAIDEEAAEEIARGGNCFAKQWELVEWGITRLQPDWNFWKKNWNEWRRI
jgi:hypothetical protein